VLTAGFRRSSGRVLNIVGPAKRKTCKENSAKNIYNRFPLRSCYVQQGIKIRDFRPISHFISETIQNMAIVTMEDDYEPARNLSKSNGAISNDIE